MAVVAADFPMLVQWFEHSISLEGFLTTYSERVRQDFPTIVRNGHSSLTLACACAALGDFVAAKTHAEEALADFQRIHRDFIAAYPAAEHWAPERIQRTEELLVALRDQSVEALLESWRQFTSAAFKLTR
jgi:hypothetical protein